MARYSDFSSGTVPDMLLYNSDNCHFDLLVEDNSRLAVFGLISMGEENQKGLREKEVRDRESREKEVMDKEVKHREMKEKEVSRSFVDFQQPENQVDNQWTTVKHSRNGSKSVRIVEKDSTTQIDESLTKKHNNIEHKKTGSESAIQGEEVSVLTVTIAKQMENLSVSESQCDICKDKFVKEEDL